MSKDNRTFLEKIKDEAGQSVASGIIGVIIAQVALDVNLGMKIPFMGTAIPVWGALGLTIAGADALAYASHDFIVEKIPYLEKLGNIENRVAAPLISGLATYGLLTATVSSNVSLLSTMALGGGSSILGRYGYGMIIDKM